MEKLFFFGFEHDFSVDPAAEQFPEGKIVGNPFFPGFEQLISMVQEAQQLPAGKITGKSRFCLVLSGIFPCFVRKNKVENPFFLGFGRDFSMDPPAERFPEAKIMEKPFSPGFEWDFSMFWEIKITWKIRFSLVLGWPGAGPAGVWGGFGNPGLIPHLWNAPKWDFPQNSLFWKGFSPLLPLEPGWGKIFFFFLGWGKIPNPRLWSSWELIPLIGSL